MYRRLMILAAALSLNDPRLCLAQKSFPKDAVPLIGHFADGDDLKVLADTYNDPEQWDNLQTKLRDLLKGAGPPPPEPNGPAPKTHELDFKQNHYLVVFSSARSKTDPTAELIRVVVHDPAPSYRNRNKLLDAKQLFQVLVNEDVKGTLTSTYVFTPVDNPIMAQIPTFVAKLRDSFIAALGTLEVGPEKPAYLLVTHVALRSDRATLKVSDKFSLELPAKKLSPDETKKKLETFSAELDDLTKRLQSREARTSPCASSLAARFQGSLKKMLADFGNLPGPCKQQENQKCWKEMKSLLSTELELHLRETKSCNLGDTSALPPQAAQASFLENQVIVETARQYEAALEKFTNEISVPAPGEKIEQAADFEFKLAPKERYSFNVVTAAIFDPRSNGRVKLSSGKLADDPITGPLTTAVLNFHALGFDPDEPQMTSGERYRFFLGGVITPEFGLSAGVGIGLVRNVSLNAGYAVLWIDKLKDGETLGEAPVDDDPLRNGLGGAFFIGLGAAL